MKVSDLEGVNENDLVGILRRFWCVEEERSEVGRACTGCWTGTWPSALFT